MIEEALAWWRLHEEIFWYVSIGSLLVLMVSALVAPLLVARLPSDYFARDRAAGPRKPAASPWLRLPVLAVKNTVGGGLVVAGFAMLFLPGQGILTILGGLALMDFPGKRGLERRVVRLPAVLRAVNWMRRRAGREGFRF